MVIQQEEAQLYIQAAETAIDNLARYMLKARGELISIDIGPFKLVPKEKAQKQFSVNSTL